MDLAAPLFDHDPFTPATAARAGIGRTALEQLVRQGRVVRLVRGVYLDADAPTPAIVRARALALVVGRRHVVIDRTAAWVHGAEPDRGAAGGPVPLDVHTRRRRLDGPVRFGPGDLSVLGGVRCTTALRTAVDVARHLVPERGLPLLDGMLAAGSLSHQDLLTAMTALENPGAFQARELAAMADGRAAHAGESVLRLHWYDARLPTPTPALRVGGVRLALGLPTQRFGVVLSGQAGEVELLRCARSGWRVLVLDRVRVMSGDPVYLIAHLEREFHQHLLTQVG